ncbi:unnamed protein product [Euphydryas editha]|uniref:Peptidase S1 domain-containing protein n=1 Tax=Euphydryas editha TaxID=104508 RepID=A0AAU9U2F7_EUPED|nr:unnamed protein product [Euphydryas editha]
MEKSFFLSIFILFCGLFVGDVKSKRRINRSAEDPTNVDNKIVGGYDITIQDVPYQVYLLLQTGTLYNQCGGTIISEKYVLTAAHCLTGVTRIYVRAGSTSADSGGTQYSTTQYLEHPFYNPVTSDNDIGLITIPGGITLDGTNTRAVALPDASSTIAPGTNLLITGWGLTTENGSVSQNLKAVQISTISNDECRKAYNTLTTRQFCAGVPQGGKDACQGDSGGPAVATDSGVQVGVISFGEGCAQPGNPGVYTDVAKLRSWIKINSGV